PIPAGGERDRGGPGAARGPAARLQPVLLGRQPRLLHRLGAGRGDGGRELLLAVRGGRGHHLRLRTADVAEGAGDAAAPGLGVGGARATRAARGPPRAVPRRRVRGLRAHQLRHLPAVLPVEPGNAGGHAGARVVREDLRGGDRGERRDDRAVAAVRLAHHGGPAALAGDGGGGGADRRGVRGVRGPALAVGLRGGGGDLHGR